MFLNEKKSRDVGYLLQRAEEYVSAREMVNFGKRDKARLGTIPMEFKAGDSQAVGRHSGVTCARDPDTWHCNARRQAGRQAANGPLRGTSRPASKMGT
ncbi:hypothetical protein HPB50_001876 [Hyalomma asiaticum]|uniref:Uncharacterized protein n=1 Tax=Hyalomma asiaticum TaxID=266040 RepID=A0ACB7S0A3_HYAAI|nr:hypothetical protein HPB50_001876 [Hyalomma asiaticum]